MIRHVEEHRSGAQTKRCSKQPFSAVCVRGNKRPNLISANTLTPHHETGI